jgi:hypothetical protein
MRSFVVFALVALVLTSVAFAADSDDRLTLGGLNGLGWSGLSEPEKVCYLRGIYDGIGLVGDLKTLRYLTDAIWVDVPHEEIARAVDAFYADSLNRRIPVISALTWVKRKSNGATASELDQMAARIRASVKSAK